MPDLPPIVLSVISFGFSILGAVLRPFVAELAIWRLMRKDADLTGYYRTKWRYKSDQNGQEHDVYDIVYFEKRRSHTKGYVFYSSDKSRIYSFRGKEYADRISGHWKNNAEGYEGDFTLIPYISQGRLKGFWAGKDRSGDLQIKQWEWEKIKEANIPAEIMQLDFDKDLHRQAMLNFVAKLERESQNAHSQLVEDIEIRLDKGIFSPHLGEISLTFFQDCVKNLHNKDVLDMCTGSGLYAIKAAKNGCRVVGVDISQKAIQVAHINARNNRCEVDFRVGSMYEALNKDERFDVILANLPFTSKKNAESVKNSSYYNSVSLDPDLLKEFILGAEMHLKPGGEVLFTFGSSGDIDYLFFLVSMSSLKAKMLDLIRKPEVGESFYVLRLTRAA